MNARDGRYEAVHRLDWLPNSFTARNQPTPLIGNCAVDQDDSTLESGWKVTPKPLIHPTAPGTRGHPVNPVPQFGKSHNAEKNIILVDFFKPLDDATSRLWFRPFRHDVRVE